MADEIKSEESEGPSRSLWLAALLVGAIVIAGVVLSVRGVLRDDPESTATPTTSTSSPASPAEGEDASVCGLKGHERSGSLTDAPRARWVLVGSIASPRVEDSGPGVVDDETGFGYCYARTREGVVVAAVNLIPFTATNELQEQAYEKSLVPGPGRDAAIKAVANGQAEEVPSDARLQVAGFQLVRYSDTEATVRVASSMGGRFFHQEVVMRWSDGDWKVVVNDDGSMIGQSGEIPDLTGYVPWSGA